MRNYIYRPRTDTTRNFDRRITPVPKHQRTRLSNWVWATRQAQHLTQDQLAERAGVSRRTIHAIETNKQWPTLIVALKLAHALNAEVETLFMLRQAICCERHIAQASREAGEII